MNNVKDMTVRVEWDTGGEVVKGLSTLWTIPAGAFSDADGESADINGCVCDYLCDESGWLVADWEEVEVTTITETLGEKLVGVHAEIVERVINETRSMRIATAVKLMKRSAMDLALLATINHTNAKMVADYNQRGLELINAAEALQAQL